eukprot:CAMPEP_0206469300 /NCGR_PEP_ID=MMETSP0324_2-20121206/30187_1 /ASSEMBLY_ACC=CAM_ASM_000836 /TAXON_ID=2866 /ORGANISM="Crypthecodinium cohnii, Strain Seligo" /LENGTH=162 /DNA_ID=CAMNT_0053943011 /DNA_START=30 /DNA_END=518 /DNA_ORIENTATION=+
MNLSRQQQQQQRVPMRSVTEYIKSPHQQAAAKIEGSTQTKEQLAAKNHFRKSEAQGIAEGFKFRLERVLREEFEEWTVTLYKGDLIRKALLKVRVNEEEYVHLFLDRPIRGEAWLCRYAPWKSAEDALEQTEDEYEILPERTQCSDKINLSTCTTNLDCNLM